MLTIHESFSADGERNTVALGVEDGMLLVHVSGESDTLVPRMAIERVMRRYGKPLDESVALSGPRLDLGDGYALTQLRYLPRYDVIARDFLVWSTPGGESLVELSTAVSAALVHLARGASSVTSP